MGLDNNKNKSDASLQRKDTKESLQKMRTSLLDGQETMAYLCSLEDERHASYQPHDALYLEGLEDERRLK